MVSGHEQLFLVADPAEAKSRTKKVRTKSVEPAAELPIACVRVDVPVAHLDREFDYVVPRELDEQARLGSKVRVRFNGKLTDAIIVNRIQESEFAKLQPIERVIGPALTPETLTLVNAVTQRYAGLFWDVIRSAVPVKHGRARADGSSSIELTDSATLPESPTAWRSYDHGELVLDSVARHELVRACWSSAPATDWRLEVLQLVRAHHSVHNDKGLLIVLPDAKDVEQCSSYCAEFNPTIMTAEMGTEERYRSFLQVYSGESRFVIGTRTAVFAPIKNLSLIILWDDGNDNFGEAHAPYWDAREVAAIRSHEQECSLIVGGPSRSVVTQYWCNSGWMRSIAPDDRSRKTVQQQVRGMRPEDAGRDPAKARIPHVVWESIKSVVDQGPVLVQVARRGYVPTLLCTDCGDRAVCQCGGAISIKRQGAGKARMCQRCGSLSWRCHCGGTEVKALAIGAERTAEEIGRAFAGTPVLWSQADRIIASVDDSPRIVVATPGAEPWAEGGFRAVAILDAVSSAVSLTAQESLVRRIFSAAVLAAPSAKIVIAAPTEDRSVQALSRWDSIWFAEREIAERAEAHLPPATRAVRLDGKPADVDSVITMLKGFGTSHALRVLGPVVQEGESKAHAFLLVPRTQGVDLVSALTEITKVRSTDSKNAYVQVRVDPRDF